MIRRGLIVLLGVLVVVAASPLSAKAESDEQTRDKEVADRAKRRQYPGGPDESDLKVQNSQTPPTRKMAPAIEEDRHESSED